MLMMIALTCAGEPCAHATPQTWEYTDVLQWPASLQDVVASNILTITRGLGYGEAVSDYGIIGSYAAGCARAGGSDPSDIDIAVFLSITNQNEYDTLNMRSIEISQGKMTAVARTIGFPYHIDIVFRHISQRMIEDPDYIFYSLKDRCAYGRINGEPRGVKTLYVPEIQRFVNVDRHAYTTLYERCRLQRQLALPRAYSNDMVWFGERRATNHLFCLPVVRLNTIPMGGVRGDGQ